MKSSLNNTLFFPSNNEKQTENFKQVEGELRQPRMTTTTNKVQRECCIRNYYKINLLSSKIWNISH